MNRRDQREQQRGGRRQGGHAGEHNGADPKVVEARDESDHGRRNRRARESNRDPGEREREHDGDRGEEAAFEKGLPREPAARGAQREPHGVLLRAFAAACQQQIGDVRARDEHEQQRGGLHGGHEGSGAGVRHAGPEVENGDRPRAVGFGILALLTLDDRGHLGTRLLQRDALRQLAEDPEKSAPALVPLVGGVRQRRPDFRAFGNREARRGNADHFMGLAVQSDGLAHDAGVTRELPLPETMAEDGTPMLAGGFLFRQETATERRALAKGCEEIRRDVITRDLLRRLDPRQVGVPPFGG